MKPLNNFNCQSDLMEYLKKWGGAPSCSSPRLPRERMDKAPEKRESDPRALRTRALSKLERTKRRQ